MRLLFVLFTVLDSVLFKPLFASFEIGFSPVIRSESLFERVVVACDSSAVAADIIGDFTDH